MNIQDMGAAGEIVGSIAVIATLIYLSLQIRQANISTHRNMYAQSATAMSEYWLTLAREPHLHEVFGTMLRSPESLAKKDLNKAYLVMDSFLSLMESYYLHNMEYQEKLSQERWERMLRRMFNTPGGRLYWSNRETSFHDDFSAYLSSLIDPES